MGSLNTCCCLGMLLALSWVCTAAAAERSDTKHSRLMRLYVASVSPSTTDVLTADYLAQRLRRRLAQHDVRVQIVTEPSFGLGDWHTQVIVQDGLARVRVIDPDGKEAMRRDVALYERSSREVAHTIVLTIAEAFSPLFDDLSSAIVDRQGSGSNLKGAQVVTTTPGLLRWRLGAFAEASSSQPGGATALGGGVDLGIAGVRWVANLSLVLSPPKIDEGNDYRIKLASGRVRLAGGVHYLWGDFDMTADLGVTSRWVEEVRRGEGIVAGQRWYAETSIGPRGGVAWYVTRRLAVGLDLLVDRFFPYHAFVVDGRTVLHTGRLVVHGRLGALMAF